MLLDRDFGNDAFFLVAPLLLLVSVGCSRRAGCGTGESCGSGPRWAGGSVPTASPCVSEEVSSCRVVFEAHVQTVLLRGGLAHRSKQMARPLAVA